jgi:hypothetical protein
MRGYLRSSYAHHVGNTVIKLAALVLSLTGCALAADAEQVIDGQSIFPSDHVINTPIDGLLPHPDSDLWINTIGAGTRFHSDFGSDPSYGIPYNTLPTGYAQTGAISFDYGDESDPTPYPCDNNMAIEGGSWDSSVDGDRHVLSVRSSEGELDELFAVYDNGDGTFRAGSGAKWDLNSYTLRPDGWTSSDAAGLPVMPLLINYDEVASGVISHALRFTCVHTGIPHLWPARHDAGSHPYGYPPNGARLRLKAGFDISGFSPPIQVILTALKTFGAFVADNGSNWYFTGTPDPRWDSVPLSELNNVHGSDFEGVDESSLMIDPDSGQANQPTGPRGGGAHKGHKLQKHHLRSQR